MMRQPSSFMRLHQWWKDALAGLATEQHDGLPECGCYKLRYVKGGPFVPVRIFVLRDIDPDTGELQGPERIMAEANGLPADPVPIWTYLRPISRADYDALVEMHRSEDRMSATNVALDLSLTPTLPPRSYA